MQWTRGVKDSTRIQVTGIVVVKKWMQQKYARKNKQTGLIFSFATGTRTCACGILDFNFFNNRLGLRHRLRRLFHHKLLLILYHLYQLI